MRLPTLVLPHRARVLRSVRAGQRTEQGERLAGPAESGEWFPARRVTRGRGGRGPADRGGATRAEVPWSLIWGDEYEDGRPLDDPPTAGERVQVEVELDGGGTRLYTYEVVTVGGSFDAGRGPFGGQADLVEVVQTS